jgi:large subunit ribosomal protein L4
MPKKARQLAIKSALSARLESLILVEDFSKIEPKTKEMVKILKDINAQGKTLIIADFKADNNKNLELAARNLPNVKLLLPTNLNVKDLIEATSVVVTKDAIKDITERLS